MKSSPFSIMIIVVMSLTTGCVNKRGGEKKLKSLQDPTFDASPSPLPSSQVTHEISQILVIPASNGSTELVAQVNFKSENNGTKRREINADCNPGAGLTCNCQYRWTETNDTGGTSTTVSRLVETALTSSQAYQALCPLPPVYNSEILDNTEISLKLVAAAGNGSKFAMNPATFVKKSATAGCSGPNQPESCQGSFKDEQGRSFHNIHRYSCYEVTKKSLTLHNRRGFALTNNTSAPTREYPIASQFCFRKGDDQLNYNSSSGSTCLFDPPISRDNSSESAYVSLYIRDSQRGSIVTDNGRYFCPNVQEPLQRKDQPILTGKVVYPYDTQFSLAFAVSQDYPIPVESYTKLNRNGNTDFGVLGYAAKPNSDGSCPMIKIGLNAKIPTYRLRRYMAIYPPHYDAGGQMIDAQTVDLVYVSDRPVNTGIPDDTTTAMLGPKPCPFAYFDRFGVTQTSGTAASYVSTTEGMYPGHTRTWSGKNVDSTQFPYFDTVNSCAAAMVLPNADRTTLSIGTVHRLNPDPSMKRMYVRGVEPWYPRYVEDATFQACAPFSRSKNSSTGESFTNIQDPPLHMQKAGPKTVAWCAEVYPSQTPYVVKTVGSANASSFTNFTSHLSKGTPLAKCTATSNVRSKGTFTLPSDMDGGGSSNETCDRTISNPEGDIKSFYFPLLAPSKRIEEVLSRDPSFQCNISYVNTKNDSSGASAAKIGKESPGAGCCGRPSNGSALGVSLSNGTNSAHWEPNSGADTQCGAPDFTE